MLILAGGSINAIVGEDGILGRTQYATFLSEMTAVEEAVQMWKAGEAIGQMGEDAKVIPANGLCKVNDLTKTERLYGEVGYYRQWNNNEGSAPTIDILSSASDFNDFFDGDLIFFPIGVQDLYYLNNEAIGIKGDKTYLIDAATGMIYSINGVRLKGVSCYSANMATAVMSGSLNTPMFAEAEVSGSVTGDKLAGNVQDEYLENGEINSEYNPYGFQIIASPNSNNIFKLYNNGDLYGKGIKGPQLNTSKEKMAEINSYEWKEWTVPKEVGEYKKIIIGATDTYNLNNTSGGGTMYFIDQNDDLWVYGNNPAGLSLEQSIEYTGRKAMKLDLRGFKASRVFAGLYSVFVITTDNHLLAAGSNANGQLGLGHTNPVMTFEEVNVENIQNIETIYPDDHERLANVIKYNNNTFYFAGRASYYNAEYADTCVTFSQMFDGIHGPDWDQDIKDISWTSTCVILKSDGTVWVTGYGGYMMDDLSSESERGFRKHKVTNIEKFYPMNTYSLVIQDNNNKLYCFSKNNTLGTENNSSAPKEMELPVDLINEGIKECFAITNALYILSNTGNIYGTGYKYRMGMNLVEGFTDKIVKLDIDNVQTLYSNEVSSAKTGMRSIALLYKNNKYYTTGNSILMFGDDVLEKNWTLVANNVKQFNAKGNCFVDKDKNLWVSGDSRCCGLGEKSKNYENIPNYIKCTDANIQGKVIQCEATAYVTYVLLENKELWATGLYSNSGLEQYPGWEEEEDKSNFVKILDDIYFFSAYCDSGSGKIAISKNGEAYGWGASWGGQIGIPGTTFHITPEPYTLPVSIGGTDNIRALRCDNGRRATIITTNGQLFMTGSWTNGQYDGGREMTSIFAQYTYNLNLEEGEKITSISHSSGRSSIVLTDKGRVFGYGPANVMGFNNTSDRLQEMHLIKELNGKNIVQIAGGNGWYVAVDADGKVYGTGSNTYGILGRWKGAPRSAGRYRTAFEWVECPELEI